MQDRTLIAIDPGKLGAVAVLKKGARRVRVYDTPRFGDGGDYDVRTMGRLIRAEAQEARVSLALERVHSMPGQGVATMFAMGRGLGLWQGIIAAQPWPIELLMVNPEVWKKDVLMAYPKRSGPEGKMAAVAEAERLYPYLVLRGPRGRLLDGRGDAVCMLEWLKRKKARS